MAEVNSEFVKYHGTLWRVIARHKTGYLSLAIIGQWLTTIKPPTIYVNKEKCEPIKILTIPIGLYQLICLRNTSRVYTHLTKTMDKLLEKKNEYDIVLFVNYQTNKYVYTETNDVNVKKVIHMFNEKDKIACVAIETKHKWFYLCINEMSNLRPSIVNNLTRTDTFQRSKKAWWNGMLKWKVK